jgi:hypothetical protein
MNTVEFDYDAFLDGLESASTLSTTSPTTTENDTDSGIAYTPPMPMGLDDTVIDFDALGKSIKLMKLEKGMIIFRFSAITYGKSIIR